MQRQSFAGKVVLVTGAAQGIGRGIAQAFVDRGARVVVADLDHSAGRTAATELGDGAEFCHLDVGDEAAVAHLVQDIVARHGRLDCAINNAGILGPLKALWEWSEEEFDGVVRVNLDGCRHCLKHEIAAMLAGGGGCIVNISSVNGLRGMPTCAIYSATKAAVLGLTRTAAREHARHNLRINAICPGPISGGLLKKDIDQIMAATAVERMGSPAEVGEAVVWLCSPAASYIHGEELRVDGGLLA
jgi:NAD(P)-dependent dehydrogenase (short-subunit alcohol dehydrogenase family)